MIAVPQSLVFLELDCQPFFHTKNNYLSSDNFKRKIIIIIHTLNINVSSLLRSERIASLLLSGYKHLKDSQPY